MLHIDNLAVQVDSKKVLEDISCQFLPGSNYCILGKNWSGKSSLALTVMGHPSYQVIEGKIEVDGKNVLEMSPDQRAQAWIFLAFQVIPEIKWVKLFEFLRTIYNSKRQKKESFVSFKKIILPYMEELKIDPEFLRRDLNVGFSGGERRKIEILQLKILQPTYIFLDEVDSWLDVDAFRSVVQLLKEINNENNCFIVITHYFTILEHVPVDQVIVLDEGHIVAVGDKELAEQIKNHWFEQGGIDTKAL